MKFVIPLIMLILIGCGERPDSNMKCSNERHSNYRKCTPLVVREILHICKKNDMNYTHMIYPSTNQTSEVFCDPFQTTNEETYWNTIPSNWSMVSESKSENDNE
jgi:hypothetical protein